MSSKADKKLRKEYRQMYEREMRDRFNESAEAEKQAQLLQSLIKPEPKWMPAFVYWWCFNVVFK